MRIAVLCNDRVALPALDYLLSTGKCVAVGMSDRKCETEAIIRNKCSLSTTPFQQFSKKNFEQQLLQWLDQYQPDVVLVKTFPYLVPASALRIPRYGFINFHYAPLPEWRGANPLFWMLRNRAAIGGLTVHEMNEDYDTGPVLLEQPMHIGHNINFGILYTQLAFLGVQATVQLLDGLSNGSLQKKQQDDSKAGWYAHPKDSDLIINWQNMEAEDITALIKACNPWNKGAATRWKGWTFGITYASVVDINLDEKIIPGTVLSIEPGTGLIIASKNRKAVNAEVIYCEEGFYPGYCLSAFGLQTNDRLS